LGDDDPHVRARAAKVLGRFGRHPGQTETWDPRAVSRLTAAISDPDIRVRYAAVCALQSLVTRQPGLSPADKQRVAAGLLEHLRSHPDDSISAEMALASMGASSVPAFVELARDPSPVLRRRAAWAFLYLAQTRAEVTGPALPAIRQAADDADAQVRAYARDALGKLGTLPAEKQPGPPMKAERDEPARRR